MRWKVILLVICCLSGAPYTADAQQERQTVQEGDRIRVSALTVQGEFTVARSSGDTLVIHDSGNVGETIILPLDLITSLDVRRARSTGSGVMRGAGIGLLVGAAGGSLIGVVSGDDPPTGWIRFSAGEKAVMAGVTLGVAGFIVGGIAGFIHPGGWWERVDLDQGIGLSCGGDGAFRLYYSHRF